MKAFLPAYGYLLRPIYNLVFMQALAARLVEGLVLPLLASRGPAAVSRAATGASGGVDEAAVLHWRLGIGAPVEDALLECLAFVAGDASAGARRCCTV